jgi:hypothetical protein
MSDPLERQAETPYLETEILIAVMAGDTDLTDELINEMLPGERATFQGQLTTATRALFRIRQELGEV